MSRGGEIRVAGAGVLGLSCALALADAGCAVTVYDPALDGQNASSVAAGMLAPVFETVLDPEAAGNFDLLLAARDLWPALAQRAGISLDRSGAVAVGSPTWLAAVIRGVEALGLPMTELTGAPLQALTPAVAAPFTRGVATTEDWRLEPGPALRALRVAAEAAGVSFVAAPAAGRGSAAWLVVATGSGQGLAQEIPELMSLTPIKGQILRYRQMADGGPSVRGEGVYAAPSGDGLAIGATMEPGMDDTRVDPGALDPLVRAALRLFPGLTGATFTVSAGVRAATSDGLPMAGPAGDPRTLLAVGARRNGWLLAPLVARLITAYVTGAEPGPHAHRLDPARFRTG